MNAQILLETENQNVLKEFTHSDTFLLIFQFSQLRLEKEILIDRNHHVAGMGCAKLVILNQTHTVSLE